MSKTHLKTGRDRLEVLFTEGAIGHGSDADLLDRFVRGRGDTSAELAFAALVTRHGPMVLGVCQRITSDCHAAEDAFQAVFLILARKASSVRLRPGDSLGRWLYGVSLKVARRARAGSVKRRRQETDLDGLDPVAPSTALNRCERGELRAAIDAEIARLPVRFRSVVVLCYLEGLSHKDLAERLGCPVGTVESRLHRARERLRAGLVRRGLAPAVGALFGLLERTSRAAVPLNLAKPTVAVAIRISAGEAFVATSPAAIALLAKSQLRSMMMRYLCAIVGVATLSITSAAGLAGLAATGGDEPKTKPSSHGPEITVRGPFALPDHPLADKLDQLEADYERAQRAFMSFYQGSTIPEKDLAKAVKVQPDFSAFVRRIFDLAAAAPNDPAVRDAMLWVIRQSRVHAHGSEFALAANWLVQHFGDDPDAVHFGLQLDNGTTFERDKLLFSFYASAKGRESKGFARLALAQYLQKKAIMAEGAKKVEGRPTYTHEDLVRADGTLYTEKEVMPDQDYAYLLHLKHCDVSYLRAEAERLYDEVIAEYADVPYIRPHDRILEAALNRPEPRWNGVPIPEENREKLKSGIAKRRSTLGKVAEARLDDWLNLADGKMAPEITGVDSRGKPMKLSDYRGRVVALVFWSTGCGPCMRQIPNEKALVERMNGRPFAMLGVNTDADADAARKAMESNGITWPNWFDGPGDGPIAERYHLRGLPTIYVIDAKGMIRSKRVIGSSLDQLVEKLVAER